VERRRYRNVDARELLELQVLEDANRTRNSPAKVTYNTANEWLLVEAAERLVIDRLINITTAQERDGDRSVTLIAFLDTGDARLRKLRDERAAEDRR
jgi:hypothetical protein